MSKQVVIKEKGYSLTSPTQMTELSTLLKSHIIKNELYTTIRNKNYAHVEGWQFAGGMMGLFPRVVEVTDLSKTTECKWSAKVEIVNIKTGEIMSVGFALCSNKEIKKKSFDEYAVMSMAQTRAIGKAYRNMLGWVMKLAGMEGTPSEEMTKMGDEPKEAVINYDNDIPTFTCKKCGVPVSESEAKFSKKRYGIVLCDEHQEKARLALASKKK